MLGWLSDAASLWSADGLTGAAVGLLLLGGFLAIRQARREGRADVINLSLRLGSLLLIAWCLCDPRFTSTRVRPGENVCLVLADNSLSLAQPLDASGQHPANRAIAEITNADRTWRRHLEQDFDVRTFQFDEDVHLLDDLAHLNWRGSSSRLAAALRELSGRFTQVPVAGVILLTDGNATDIASLDDLAAVARSLKFPIYSVPIGTDVRRPDLAIGAVQVRYSPFEDAPSTVQVEVHSTGDLTGRVIGELVDSQGQVVTRETLELRPSVTRLPLEFRVPSTRQLVAEYTVQLSHDPEAADPLRTGIGTESATTAARTVPSGPANTSALPEPATAEAAAVRSTETCLDNNSQRLVIDRGQGPYRVLYVSGRPNWEYKFLQRALARDDQLQLTAIVRIARKQPKFEWRGRGEQPSNSLFRGFDGATDTTETYDQPVLVRLGTESPNEFPDGFPSAASDLFPFRAIILDDIEADFFTPQQQELIQRFVVDRGGGLLCLGGLECFAEGGYARQLLGRLIPVELSRTPIANGPPGPQRLSLSPVGMVEPWLRLKPTEAEERTRFAEMPDFLTLNLVGPAKPGATVLAWSESTTGQRNPAIVAQRFGQGQVAAVLLGDLWRWQLTRRPEQAARDELGKFWRQAIRWLVTETTGRLELQARPAVTGDFSRVNCELTVRTAEFEPWEGANVELTYASPGLSPEAVDFTPDDSAAGVSKSQLRSRQVGLHRVAARIPAAGDKPEIKAAAHWVFDPTAQELRSLVIHREALEALAKNSGGAVVEARDLDRFVPTLVNRPAPRVDTLVEPAWHRPWVSVLLAAALLLEWARRRRRGLP